MAAPEPKEIASLATDPAVPLFQLALTPSDETLKMRGGVKGHAIYDEIKRDPHAFAVLQKRKLEVTSREWAVIPASEAPLDRRAADEVERQLKNINFDRLTGGMMGAVLKGFAVAEVIWKPSSNGFFVANIKVKKQRRFRFNVEGELRLLTRSHPNDGEAVPDQKFIVHRHSIDDDDDDPYGVGLGSVLFWPAWFKRQALSHWLRGTEKHATPTTIASYQGAFDQKRNDELLAALRGMANDTVLVVPENVQLALLEATKGGGGDLYESLNRYLDELMSEAVLGETLTTNSGKNGARSLGEIHNEIRVAIAKADADLLSQTFKQTLIQWIIDLNFPGAGIPEVWRDFTEAEDLNARVNRDKTLHDMGYRPTDPGYISETYGGDWQAKTPEPDLPVSDKPASKGTQTALEALFADKQAGTESESDAVAAMLTDQLEPLAAPHIDAMIAAVRQEVQQAASFDDLAERLLRLSSELGIDDLAGMMEQAITVAELTGVASVKDQADGH